MLQQYIDLLKEKIIPSIQERYPDHGYIFQDDYDSIHRANVTLDFIEENIPSRIMLEDRDRQLRPEAEASQKMSDSTRVESSCRVLDRNKK